VYTFSFRPVIIIQPDVITAVTYVRVINIEVQPIFIIYYYLLTPDLTIPLTVWLEGH